MPRTLTVGGFGAARPGQCATDVHRYRRALQNALRAETKAYGFALVVWGTGSLVMAVRGAPGRSGAVGYVAGMLVAMAVVLGLAFGAHPGAQQDDGHDQHFGFGGIHVLSVPVAMAAGWGAAELVRPHWASFMAAGGLACLAYQLLLGLEIFLTPARLRRH